MKFALLVVGRTVEKHYITAINDYVERIKHYTPFDMEVIPELKNTKNLSMEQQKEKEGELILKALQPGDVVVLLDEHGKEFRSIEFAEWAEKKDAYRQQTARFHHRRPLRILKGYICCRTGKDLSLENDLLTSDDPPDLCRTAVPRHEYSGRRTLSP